MSFMNNVFDPNRHSYYQPLNPKKYIGKQLPICRSSYETAFCKWCDTNTNILEWVSEPFAIRYYDPVKRKKRRYYPDFFVKVRDSSNNERSYVIEIKPLKEVNRPTGRGSKKSQIREATTYATNASKWNAANNWCVKKGWEFKIVTEKELFK